MQHFPVMTAAHDETEAVLAASQDDSEVGKITQSEPQPTMKEEIKINISALTKDAMQVVLGAAAAWS